MSSSNINKFLSFSHFSRDSQFAEPLIGPSLHLSHPTDTSGGTALKDPVQIMEASPAQISASVSLSAPVDETQGISINSIKSQSQTPQRIKSRQRDNLKMNLSFTGKARAPWNETVKNALLQKLRNRNATNAVRYIRRDKTAAANVGTVGFIKQKGYKMMYHKLIDRPWIKLLIELFLIYFSMYVVFGTICYGLGMAYNSATNPDIIKMYDNNYWSLCFDFGVHTGTTIGFGHLLPTQIHHFAFGAILFVFVYATEIFDVLFIGVLIQKIKKPTRLKTQLRFSEFAVINAGYSTTKELAMEYRNEHSIDTSLKFQSTFPRHLVSDFDYESGTIHDVGSYAKSAANDQYKCLMFRFCHIRPQSRMCMPSMSLLYYQHDMVTNEVDMDRGGKHVDWMSHKHHEMDFEIYKKHGRMRSADMDIPLLSLPWTVVHKIDESSPLYGLTKQDLVDRKIEIIAVVGGIDEITSDNFQQWWSFTADEIEWEHQFEPMVKSIVHTDRPWYYYLFCGLMDEMKTRYREVLEIDFERLSLISPITRYTYT